MIKSIIMPSTAYGQSLIEEEHEEKATTLSGPTDNSTARWNLCDRRWTLPYGSKGTVQSKPSALPTIKGLLHEG